MSYMEWLIKALYLCGGAMTMSLQNIFKKAYKDNALFFFSFCTSLFAFAVFIFASGFKFNFEKGILLYALSFGVLFSVCTITLTFAVNVGNLAISGLIISFSLILPTSYGIFFLNNPFSVPFIIGLFLLAVSLCFVNLGEKKVKKKTEHAGGKKTNAKWLVLILVAAICNGACSIVQTAFQTAYDYNYKSEFMIVALAFSCIVLFIASIIVERGKIRQSVGQAFVFGGASGIMSGLLNLFVMLSISIMPAAVVFPVIAGGSLIPTFFIAVVFFKEKYSVLQWVGYATGLISVVLLNL